MSLARNPFVKALAFSAALHGMTVGSLEALSGMWKRSPKDWIPQGTKLTSAEVPTSAAEESSLIWLPADTAASDEVERITVTPKAMKRSAPKQTPSPDIVARANEEVAAQTGGKPSSEEIGRAHV